MSLVHKDIRCQAHHFALNDGGFYFHPSFTRAALDTIVGNDWLGPREITSADGQVRLIGPISTTPHLPFHGDLLKATMITFKRTGPWHPWEREAVLTNVLPCSKIVTDHLEQRAA